MCRGTPVSPLGRFRDGPATVTDRARHATGSQELALLQSEYRARTPEEAPWQRLPSARRL